MTGTASPRGRRQHARQVAALWGVLAVGTVALAWQHVDRLGMYYDEAFLAQQARDFVEPSRMGVHPGSVRSIEILGRPFPVRNAAYLGSLKSQLLIPSLAIAGSTPRVVRITTLTTGLLALLLAMLWTERVLGRDVAMLAGLLVATDASFYFYSQFEWGPFTTNLLCRTAGLLFVTLAWQRHPQRRSLAYALAGGAAFGLGFFSRADFGLVIAAFALALAVSRPALLREALGQRRRVALAIAASMGIAASPMLLSLPGLLTASGAISERGDLAFKSRVLWNALDGSQFYRIVSLGGRFEELAASDGPRAMLGWILPGCAAFLLYRVFAERRRHEETDGAVRDPLWHSATVFLLSSAAIIVAGMLLMPGAVRAHHQLNSMPLVQIIVAATVVGLWQLASESDFARWIARGTSALILLALLAGNLHVISKTTGMIDQTGGRGRFSDALNRFAEEVDAQPGQGVVSLDWGFHEQLLFLTRQTRLHEAIWSIPRVLERGQPWVFEAGPETRYLVHQDPYDLFGLGEKLIRSARALGDGASEIETWRDGVGDTAFLSIRIPRRHRLVFTGEFEIY
jgi:hypothetical protein